MAQHDYVIANGTGAAVRSDLNNALAAIVSQNSGSTEPATTYAYMMWPDTTAGIMKMRNGANSAWIELFELDGEFGSKTFNGNITLNAQGDLRFADSDSSNWVAFQSPATVSSNVTWTLPSADGTNGQALTTNGSGTLSWTSPTSTTDKITEGNTEAEVVDTGSDGHFKVTTEGTERMRINSSGNVGIGTSSPGGLLEIKSSSADPGFFRLYNAINGATSWGIDFYRDANAGNNVLRAEIKAVRAGGDATDLKFATTNTGGTLSERARIDYDGRLLVGTSSSATGADSQDAKLQVIGSAESATGGGMITIGRGTVETSISSGDLISRIICGNSGAAEFAYIDCRADAAAGTNDFPGRLVFSTTADGASSPTERMRINSRGNALFNTTSNSLGGSNAASAVFNHVEAVDGHVVSVVASTASFTGEALLCGCYRSASTAYRFASFYSGNDSSTAFTDKEFSFRGDGNGYCDGSWNGGGADYAEYFEWSDGNPDEEDRRGISVVLDGNQIRPAVDGEDPIGVISGNPSVVGDAAWNKWSGKYLRDDYGTYILEDYEVDDEDGNIVIQQRRKLNPAYDPDQEYVNREDRPEWDCVGLMGKLRIRKGQPTGSRWIKMRDISDSVEEWLVR